ncbi:hypothetical protein LEP1GSC116_4437 [Leptospira interrogans serovar Icterohaemorrhagiae str. Verdun HP]|uniref:Lipoprotein n=1 Tax=Leptospira interrogans serovar Icterohaemorrhagiae str. Verdun HP TaxID=1049910 RepID=M6RHI6_LEPIR|nr:hypothetical protein LEP1GSC116_4437 [Leptospira interrogans serovar Icterohaemorrhagiae str. Verdun HP]
MKYTKNRKRGLRSGLILSILIFLSVNVCTSVQNGTEGIENRFVYVENVQGKNEEDFELNAKRKYWKKDWGN